jgi:two-component system cell cycle response regulator DivK
MGYSETVPMRVRERRRGVGKTVLIVEDNELNMKLFHDLLEAHGYRTIQTRNGLDALILARTYRPDLVLMDIHLPEVSGLEVVKWLKDDDELRAIPIIAVTAFAMKGDEERIRQRVRAHIEAHLVPRPSRQSYPIPAMPMSGQQSCDTGAYPRRRRPANVRLFSVRLLKQ